MSVVVTIRRPSRLSMLGLVPPLLVVGCAQKSGDWVEGTLVTVDVIGVWKGSVGGATGGGTDMEVTLAQRGARVTGNGRIRAEKMNIEGIVRGTSSPSARPGGASARKPW